MGELLTMAEIEARYAPEWVLIGDPRTDDEQRLLGGKVLDHSPDRDEVDRKARELRLDRIAVRYLGTWPEDMALSIPTRSVREALPPLLPDLADASGGDGMACRGTLWRTPRPENSEPLGGDERNPL